MSELVVKAKNGYLHEVLNLLQLGSSVHERDENDFTALYWSSCHGYPDICKILLHFGGNVNTRYRCGFTSLHAAADRGQVDCVRVLIDGNADVNIQTERGETALHLSCYRGYIDIVKILINAKINPCLKNIQNKTALQEAHSQEYDDIARILVSYQIEYIPSSSQKDIVHPVSRSNSDAWNRLSWPKQKIARSRAVDASCSTIRGVNLAQSYLNIPLDNPAQLAAHSNGMVQESSVIVQNNDMFAFPVTRQLSVSTETEPRISMTKTENCIMESLPGNRISQESLENFAEALQFKLATCEEEKCSKESENKILVERLTRCEKLLREEQDMRQQTVRRSHQHQNELMRRVAEAEHSINNPSVKTMMVNTREIKLCHQSILDLLKGRSNPNECFDWVKLCDKVELLWKHDNVQHLDLPKRELMVGEDYLLVGDLPINHYGQGMRDGACSLVFRIQYKSKFYILKMMTNLINLQFINHNEGHSFDPYLHSNFGPEYLIPLFLSGHPNIIRVLHHYQGSTERFKQYLSLLVPQNLDVPIEMATRTTFLILPEYPTTFKTFVLDLKDRCKSGLFGLSELFLLQFFYQLLSSIVFLHAKKVVHRDIKADNIFMDNYRRPVLGDFGFARRLYDTNERPVRFQDKSEVAAGNSHAWAPELCRYSRYSPQDLPQTVLLEDIYGKSDGFAAARMIYSVLQAPNTIDTFPTSSVNSPHYVNSSIPTLPDELSVEFRSILRDLVLNDPLDRPTAKQAMIRVGAILCSPKQEKITCIKDMKLYHEARLITLASIDSNHWNRDVSKKCVTMEESVAINSLEIEASFLTSLTTKEFWDIYQQQMS